MILTVNIENSSTTFGGFSKEELVFCARAMTDREKSSDEYAALLSGLLSLKGVSSRDIDGAIIASVVPSLSSIMKEAISTLTGIEALTVGPGIKTGINLRCDIPSSVGADIIAECVAAGAIFSSPTLVIDFGTVTKLTPVDERGGFSGTVIAPGVMMGMRSLSEHAAQLPEVSAEAPQSVVGRNTADAMRSGVIYGAAAMVDGLIERIYSERGVSARVLVTGDHTGVIIPHLSHTVEHDPHLALKGLNVLYRKNK